MSPRLEHTHLHLPEDHPLFRELKSLRNAVSSHQREAYELNVKLQRQSTDHAVTYKKLQQLSSENALLRSEITTLRAHPDVTPHHHALQAQELTLALRRISDKLDLSEAGLLERTKQVIAERNEREKLKSETDIAHTMLDNLRAELEQFRTNQRQMEHRVKAAEEERRMMDLTLEEYAKLVRSLEGRNNNYHVADGNERRNEYSARSVQLDGLSMAKQGLQRLLQEFNEETENLHNEIARLHASLESAEIRFRAECTASEETKETLAHALVEIDRMKIDDNAAAKVVSRYMKFSQSSTDVLHTAIANLKLRHTAAIESADARLKALEDELAVNKGVVNNLLELIDDLTEDLSREAYGRRREISLRLGLLSREEALSERLRRWVLRANECRNKADSPEDVLMACTNLVQDAESLLVGLDGDSLQEGDLTGSLGRILAAHSTVAMLQDELHRESTRRLLLEQRIASLESQFQSHLSPTNNSREKVSPISSIFAWPSSPSFLARSSAPEPATPISAFGSPRDSVPLVNDEFTKVQASRRTPPTIHVVAENEIQEDVGLDNESNGEKKTTQNPSPAVIDTISLEEADGTVSINVPVPNLDSSAFFRKGIPSDDKFSDALQSQTNGKVDSSLDELGRPTSDLSPPVDTSPIASVTSTEVVDSLSTDTPPPQQIEVHLGPPGTDNSHEYREAIGSPSGAPHRTGPSSREFASTTLPSSNASRDEVGEYERDDEPEKATITSLPKSRESGLSMYDEASGGAPSEIDGIPLPTSPEQGHHSVAKVSTPTGLDGDAKVPDHDCSQDTELGDITTHKPEEDEITVDARVVSAKPAENQESCKNIDEIVSTVELTSPVADAPIDLGDDADVLPTSPLTNLRTLISQLPQVRRYEPLQHSFRDCSIALGELKLKTMPEMRRVVDRLDDYCEDARVELEILIADDERIAKGYETLLVVPGALEDLDLEHLTKEIGVFVEGSGEALQAALKKLNSKLDNLQHDIAILKRRVHETSNTDDVFSDEEPPRTGASGWTSWTGVLLPSSRPSSPAPTFGSVITSPHRRQGSNASRMSTSSLSKGDDGYQNLGLRIPLPRARTTSYLDVGRKTPLPSPRIRTTSGMFNVGFGGGRSFSGPLATTSFGERKDIDDQSKGRLLGDNDVE